MAAILKTSLKTNRYNPYKKTLPKPDELMDTIPATQTDARISKDLPSPQADARISKDLPATQADARISKDLPATQARINKVTTNFMLGKQPYSQLSIALCDLDVEIIINRNDTPYFELSPDELCELTTVKKRVVLSSTSTDGGTLICVSQPSSNGGLTIERLIEPYSTPMEFEDCRMKKIELSRYETNQLVKHLPQAKIVIETITANKPVFDCMYDIIATTMQDIYSRLNSTRQIVESYDDIIVKLQYVPRSYFVREYLNKAGNVKTPYQLFNVVETCLAQPSYLKKRLEIATFLNWGRM